jgi:hypothetical protein
MGGRVWKTSNGRLVRGQRGDGNAREREEKEGVEGGREKWETVQERLFTKFHVFFSIFFFKLPRVLLNEREL